MLAVAGQGQENGTPWKQTAAMPAAEAHQAAAADEQFAYAISSTQVAKYERPTGRRVAVSTGDAHHLNSGFFWKDRLYCAHSNYPQQPERSEIKVLDPAAMRLTTFKDFGNLGGSLTWAVRDEDHWWCNFARYGDDNAKTFLVKFDDRWQEQGRWTYPPEVIRELGRYSLSGGLLPPPTAAALPGLKYGFHVFRAERIDKSGFDEPIAFLTLLACRHAGAHHAVGKFNADEGHILLTAGADQANLVVRQQASGCLPP
jgi:hypothetical protein